MLNYGNLNDVEFEQLCTDIMSKILGESLRRFAPGRDGGVDLADNSKASNIVVQVKYYIKTSVSGLMTSLRKEVAKVKKLNPNQYYVCCSKELSANNISEIYELFSDYMETSKNIYTLIEIDDFLTDSANIDVLRKHYKLWISSTSVLQDMFTNDVFIDSEAMLSDVEKQVKYFVQTQAYDESLKCLEKNRVLFITGDPGVGKTITSKMLILHYSAFGYRVRYTTNGTDLSQLKKSLSQNKAMKEIILLDDCFGQAYFNMKETQGSELLTLIRYIHLSQNKLLILNSRVTIYQEAKIRTPELITSFENREYKVNIIDINQMSDKEKAKIYYNHLYFNSVEGVFWKSIRQNRMYRKIVTHKNYNPRIIEFVSNSERFKTLYHENYADYVMENLDNPKNVWENEYEKRLDKVDRILLSTIYSLTETSENYEYVERIFNHRISIMPEIDLTINQFESSLQRLQESFVKIVGIGLNRRLSMVNPSINDFLTMRITPNSPEYKSIINHSMSIKQLKRLLLDGEFNELVKTKVIDTSILLFAFENRKDKNAYITYQVISSRILNKEYKRYIYSFLENFDLIDVYDKNHITKVDILKMIFRSDIYTFYLADYFKEWGVLGTLLNTLDLEDLIDIIKLCYGYFRNWHENFLQAILDELECFCIVDATNYDDDLSSIVEANISHEEFYPEFDSRQAASDLEESIENIICNEATAIIFNLPSSFDISMIKNCISVEIDGAEEIVESYFDSMFQAPDDDCYHYPNNNDDYSEIDYIFDRD